MRNASRNTKKKKKKKDSIDLCHYHKKQAVKFTRLAAL